MQFFLTGRIEVAFKTIFFTADNLFLYRMLTFLHVTNLYRPKESNFYTIPMHARHSPCMNSPGLDKKLGITIFILLIEHKSSMKTMFVDLHTDEPAKSLSSKKVDLTHEFTSFFAPVLPYRHF